MGAFVGGWLARQRRLEVEKTNHKLRRINNELRRRQQDVSYVILSCCVPQFSGLKAYSTS